MENLATPQSEAIAVAPPAATHPTLVPPGPYLSSLSARAAMRCHLRWEPDALAAPVRIYGGGREQSRSLLRPGHRPYRTGSKIGFLMPDFPKSSTV